jgi:hypothetical protein
LEQRKNRNSAKIRTKYPPPLLPQFSLVSSLSLFPSSYLIKLRAPSATSAPPRPALRNLSEEGFDPFSFPEKQAPPFAAPPNPIPAFDIPPFPG